MQQRRGMNLFSLAVSLLAVMVITGLMLSATAATNQANEFAGQVLSASGAVVVGGEATNPGHPVAGATVHLVPIMAIDISTQMTASAIYAPPYPAEVYDEPLERAVSTSVRQPVSEFTEAPPRARSGKGPGRREAVAVCL